MVVFPKESRPFFERSAFESKMRRDAVEWEMSEEKTKELLTEVMVDMLRNHRSLFREIVREALEDAGMIQAIQEGRNNDFVPEAEIMALLDGEG
jgi:hypothetical protein